MRKIAILAVLLLVCIPMVAATPVVSADRSEL